MTKSDNMPSAISALKNQISQSGVWLWLLEIEILNGPTLRYARNTEAVTYGGNVYSPFNFSIGNFVVNTDGELPEIEAYITNIGYAVQAYMRDYDGLVGSTITCLYVNTTYLDVDYSEDAMSWRVSGVGNMWPHLAVTLGVPTEVRGRAINTRYSAYACSHERFRDAWCGYVGEDIASISLPSGTPVQITTATGYSTKNIEGIEYHEDVSLFNWTLYEENVLTYNPIHITITDHGYVSGQTVTVADVSDLSPTINGDHRIRVVDDNTFQLVDTDGEDYSGIWSSGGTVSASWGGHGLVTGDDATLTGITGITPALNGNYTVTYVDAYSFTLDGTDGDDYSGAYVSGGLAGFRYCYRDPASCIARHLYPQNYGGTIGLRRNMVRLI